MTMTPPNNMGINGNNAILMNNGNVGVGINTNNINDKPSIIPPYIMHNNINNN